MSRFNPIEESEFIESQFREYLKDTINFNDPDYQTEFIKELNGQSLYKGPYLNVSLPFQSSKSINELINDGKVSKLFSKLSNINLDQKLYIHQEESLEKISNGRNIVITTGTGSGKTESFLYPVLNEIMKDIEAGKNGPGIRAILLYPMNALVNDQIDRIRKILYNYPEIRYGYYTGETEEKETKDLRERLSNENGIVLPPNEAISREEIRNNPPHLLFTNYSMLEYLMIRPKDSGIFNPDYLDHWKFVILDEAHTYAGALGIEVALLLRRLTGLVSKKPQFILTSATLGKKNRDEKDIVSFAKSLTNVEFENDDIIFAKRKNLNPDNIKYTLNPNLYIDIEKNIDNIYGLNSLIKEYVPDVTTIPEMLYELLVHDKNLYTIYDYISTGNYQFKEVMQMLAVHNFNNSNQLVSMINLINKARKDKKNLYDIKYHTFIRTLSGAFVTLNPNKQMRLSNAYYINNLRAFEIGTCRYCNTGFIFGKIIDNYLRQNTDIDIYENYGDNENIKLDYFLLKDSVDIEGLDLKYIESKTIEVEETNNDKVSKVEKEVPQDYRLCSNCGYLCKADNLNMKTCDCGEQYAVKVLKVVSSSKNNNVTTCPCCTRQSNNGIVRSVNVGKDEATAVLAQILFKAIDNDEPVAEEQVKELTFSLEPIEEKKDSSSKEAKQFIAFSDSRQQASYFAVFFEDGHDRMLRKRLLWNLIEENNYSDIPFEKIITGLCPIIEEKDLFPDKDLKPEKQAWITALYELLRIDGKNDAEGLGLFNFELNLDNIMSRLSDQAIASTFGKYNINRKDLIAMINVLFNIFRIAPAIEYTSKSGIIFEEKKEYLNFRRFDNTVKLQKASFSKKESGEEVNKEGGIASILPVGKKPNQYLDYVMRVCNISDHTEACKIIELLFITIGVQGGLFIKPSIVNDSCYQIPAERYVLKNYKNTKYYICSKCGSLTPYNVHNVCPTKECTGELHECNPDELLKNNYYRNEYINKKIERINVKEHTAQLSTQAAKEYQKRFKNKEINILSCSTTFEMGVDIGGLETVFMRNVPPSPANYVQRAGRAGRRDDSSAFVLTFCGTSSHDYTYFEEPGKMISGVIQPPKFNITNEKIILRHLMASAFGYFFKIFPDYFKNINSLILNGGVQTFKKYLDNKPKDLNEYINTKILDSNIYDKYSDYKWLELVKANGDYLDNFESEIKDLVKRFTEAEQEASNQQDYKNANYFKNQIVAIQNDEVISNLSKYNVIPKYGFPVDVVDLQVWNDGKLNTDYDLSRDLSLAISEYAPDSEIIVDKVKYTSQYITLPKGDTEFRKYYYYTCNNCERVTISDTETIKCCKYCSQENDGDRLTYFIEPIYGFKTGVTKESTSRKPKKSYAGQTYYIGNGITDENKLVLGLADMITVETSTDDELLVMNTNPFFTCPSCGFSKINKMNRMLNSYDEEHFNYRGKKCGYTTLHRMSLGHKFKTDVTRLSIKGLIDRNKALSFLYALLEGISQAFNIERKDIDGLIVKNKDASYDLIIYDNVPGGAGHVKRIVNEEMLKNTFKLALEKVSQNCCDENTSCYNCLRNYNNQHYHNQLKRQLAIEEINEIFKSIYGK